MNDANADYSRSNERIFLCIESAEHRTLILRNTAGNRTLKAANGDKNIAKWDERNDIPDNGR